MVQGTTCLHAHLCRPSASRSAECFAVRVTETRFPIISREAPLTQVGGASLLLLLVFSTEHLLLNRQPRCYDLPSCEGAAVIESISSGDDSP